MTTKSIAVGVAEEAAHQFHDGPNCRNTLAAFYAGFAFALGLAQEHGKPTPDAVEAIGEMALRAARGKR